MTKKQKYYVVWNGHQPGVYDSWENCLLQVKAYPNAKYKAFNSKEEANEAFYGIYIEPDKTLKKSTKLINWREIIKRPCIAVDAACSGNPGDLEYRGVEPFESKLIFHVGPLKKGTNNLGEFLAIVHALAWLKKKNAEQVVVYSDSRTAIKWVKEKNPKTKLEFTRENQELRQLVIRAVEWLKTNNYKNSIEKWETELWGEIPADFGRK